MQATTANRRINPSVNPSSAGLILLDAQNRVVYRNPEAGKILTFPGQLKKTATNLLPRELRLLLFSPDRSGLVGSIDFRSGRRRYACRVFVLAHNSGEPTQAMIGILLERAVPNAMDVSAVAQQYRLTRREQETVGLLTLGLTSKEIASRMNISPNTVKAFFRLVMTKMAVSTRAGIVGKIARIQPAA
jgi:DNA-binding CsgD family transcriptional regulator